MTAVEVRNWTPEYYDTNQSFCQQILKNPDILRKIPLLNDVQPHNIRHKQLIRFRGMVQDMCGPEFYLKQYEVKNIRTGKINVRHEMYTDPTPCLLDEEISFEPIVSKFSSERQLYIVISIPGLNEWAKEKSNTIQQLDTSIAHSSSMNKRSLEDTNYNDMEAMDCSEPAKKKEKVLEDNTDVNMSDDHCNTNVQNISSEDHGFPVSFNGERVCVLIYDNTVLKLNQVIDVIGFISLDSMLCKNRPSDDEINEAEINAHDSSEPLISRLHAVKIIDLNKPEISNPPEIISKAQLIRADLHIILSQILFGDQLAADYVICHLLSTIYMRRDYFCLGMFPLNITNFPASKLRTFPKEFYNFLTSLVKKSYFLEVSLESLNKSALIPKKNYEYNRLTKGILQLSNNTHLLLDETSLTAGELTADGKQNYEALSNLLMFQKLKYDFKYYTVEYETNIPMLIFSDVKSFIPCPIQIALNVDAESENLHTQVVKAAYQYLKDENRLANIRQYLELLRHTEFVFNEEMTKVVQDYFVQMRSANRNINADDLHALMVFARLMSISYGNTTLDAECWKRTIQLEMERTSRLPQRG